MVKRTTPIVSDRSLNSSVALPASTGSGVATEVNVKDALRLGEHQNDDIAGDLAAADVTRPVVAVGAIVEPVNPALASEPAITGDAAGDTAIQKAGAAPEFNQPVAVSMATLRPDTFAVDPEFNAFANTPQESTTAVEVGAGNTASSASELEPDLIVFDLSAPLTDVDRANLDILMAHFEVNEPARPAFPVETLRRAAADDFFAQDFPLTTSLLTARSEDDPAQPILRVTAKVAGFRRGGISHPAQPIDYFVGDLSPAQVEAILAEPNLVSEIV